MVAQFSTFSPLVLLALLAVLVVAAAVLVWLIRRTTIQRRWVELERWAGDHGYALQDSPPAMPSPLEVLTPVGPRPLVSLASDHAILVQLETERTPASREPHRPRRWHLLVRKIESAWPATGLRPAMHAVSVLDLLSLSSYPSVAPPGRFVLFGVQAQAVRRLSQSAIRTLLPPDVGLLLYGEYLILDFSTRHFDPIEHDRLLAVADQIVANLPEA